MRDISEVFGCDVAHNRAIALQIGVGGNGRPQPNFFNPVKLLKFLQTIKDACRRILSI